MVNSVAEAGSPEKVTFNQSVGEMRSQPRRLWAEEHRKQRPEVRVCVCWGGEGC